VNAKPVRTWRRRTAVEAAFLAPETYPLRCHDNALAAHSGTEGQDSEIFLQSAKNLVRLGGQNA